MSPSKLVCLWNSVFGSGWKFTGLFCLLVSISAFGFGDPMVGGVFLRSTVMWICGSTSLWNPFTYDENLLAILPSSVHLRHWIWRSDGGRCFLKIHGNVDLRIHISGESIHLPDAPLGFVLFYIRPCKPLWSWLMNEENFWGFLSHMGMVRFNSEWFWGSNSCIKDLYLLDDYWWDLYWVHMGLLS